MESNVSGLIGVIPVLDEDETISLMQEFSGRADGFELRIDYNPNIDLEKILLRKTKPVLVTNRTNREGGTYSGEERARINRLYEAINCGADAIDIEWVTDCSPRDELISYAIGKRAGTILSYHKFDPGQDLAEIGRVMEDAKALRCIPKIAVYVNTVLELEALRRIAEKEKLNEQKYVILAMGELGRDSRLNFGANGWGSVLSYFPLRKEQATAPGQVTLDEYLGYHEQFRQ